MTSVFKRGGSGAKSASSSAAAAPSAGPSGTRPSVFNRSIITSSGLPDLDAALGGGFALGGIVCVVDDAPTAWSSFIVKHYIAQGLASGHSTILCAADRRLLESLPADVSATEDTSDTAKQAAPDWPASQRGAAARDDDELRIAWRYKASIKEPAAAGGANVSESYCHRFDISKEAPSEFSSNARVLLVGEGSGGSGAPGIWKELSPCFQPHGDVVRVCLHSFGAPEWHNPYARSQTGGEGAGSRMPSETELLVLLRMLKGVLRTSHALVLLTLPAHHKQSAWGARVKRACDCVLDVEAVDSWTEAARVQYQDFKAALNIERLPRVNSLLAYTPETSAYLFKLRKRRLHLERMHAPPDDPKALAAPQSCGSVGSHAKPKGSAPVSLDF